MASTASSVEVHDDILFDFDALPGKPKLLGSGSCAQVFHAEWRGLPVAIKRLRNNATPIMLADFESERAVNASLRHPNIAPYLGRCTVPTKPGYALVFELAENGVLDLASCMFDVAPEKCIEVALDIARALEYAHNKGVLHRDVKPSQIVMFQSGRAALADWGLGVLEHAPDCCTGETGTWEYVSFMSLSRVSLPGV